ncbi:formimidoylglutamate deiminase [Cellulomonas fimi]|uniref:Formiminoglutamate deiminase n=1 Tax=Cellulomonas fimi (strain ATCC 484 / DSM 20113 / JCM 1341 / CCUG 24087 / LMG 16345 / NBRC 15513 / NCIMB 8980 / NCTC 7547 / NRS-133) TaxID=590998 RepID=F4H3Z8_CELFA|nr:formimidoylglutamate deiminase [Cellulomonas fimi]AEE44222.1 formiminoglutamate deiminase [Cellulomonas fimi ATCC 484]NNH05670.1 formimidoylglutamate deiminase [Cellulomonas fimi]VEH25914.1 Isoxanthopterin deaminase [Cellulomonas fimi]
MTDPRAFWAAAAWLPDGLAHGVRLTVADGRLASVTTGVPAETGDHHLPGVVLPGFANAHSHAFHRALRGRTHGDGGTFWTWRERMYALAATLTPDTYLDLARATFAEMVLAGVTAVGELHYLHHAPGGVRYDDANVMAEALRTAAADAGLRLTLLDTAYLAGGIGRPVTGPQQRFADTDAEAWAARVDALRPDATLTVGAAIHSVRAVPRDAVAAVAAHARRRALPLHVHVSEQRAENEDCLAAYGATPTRVLADAGALGPSTTAVHAVHVTPADVALLGSTGTGVCLCPSTERDLGDGLAPGAGLRAAGCRLAVGSDQHVRTDLLAEARDVEMHERVAREARGVLDPAGLVDLLTTGGHTALGDPTGGRLAVGAPADLVAVRTDTPRTAGADPAQLVLVAGSTDVDTVVVGGRVRVSGGRHALGDVGVLLARAVDAAWREADLR